MKKDKVNFLLDMELRITETMTADLSKDLTEDEISIALKHKMHPTKAPGLDGTPSFFY